MSVRLSALLVHGHPEHPEPFESLEKTLKELSVETHSAETCREAEDLIAQCKPQIVFTEKALRDGPWLNFLKMADTANVPLDVVVVGAWPDTVLYLSVMDHGAFDFVAPPFEPQPLGSLVESAEVDVRRRRQAKAAASFAW